MPKILLMATNRHQAAAIAYITIVASAATILSTEPAKTIESGNADTAGDYITPECDFETVTDSNVATWVEFQALRRRWCEERGARASALEMAMLPSYQSIVGMGEEVVPMILAQLRSEGDHPDHWFWALAAITRDNPVSPNSRGKVSEMAKAWLDWGQKKNYV